jgi:hypothetical protein
MSALADYEIHGKTKRGPVIVNMRAVATPTPEVAAYILHERYPSAEFLLTKRAAYSPTKKIGKVDARKLDAKPVRRAKR